MATQEIIVCTNCDGKGYIVEHILTDPHKGEYDITKHKCGSCKGSGRQERITTVELKHYKQPEN